MQPKEKVLNLIRQVPDFPKPGILFYDISTVLEDHDGFRAAIDAFASSLNGVEFDLIAGIDSRGFIFGSALCDRLNKGLILIRKSGKLPGVTHRVSYNLEYGEACLEINSLSIKKKPRVLLIDDLLATGGTAKAASELVVRAGGKVVAAAFLIELASLSGRKRLEDTRVISVLQF